MGWLTMANCRNATDVKNHLFKGIEESPSTELLASKSTCYGRHLWMAIKLTREGQAPSVGIVLCLLGDARW